jgi:hypothetical protein
MLLLFTWQHRACFSVTPGTAVLQKYKTNRDKLQIITLNMNQNNKRASDSTQRLLYYCQLQNNNSSETSQDIKNFSEFKTFIYLFIPQFLKQYLHIPHSILVDLEPSMNVVHVG